MRRTERPRKTPKRPGQWSKPSKDYHATPGSRAADRHVRWRSCRQVWGVVDAEGRLHLSRTRRPLLRHCPPGVGPTLRTTTTT